MTSSVPSAKRIEPLNGENYIAWRLKMEWVLTELHLWDVVAEGGPPTAVVPTAPTAEERTAIEAWQQKDYQARREIGLRINDEYLVYAGEATTAAGLWHRLTTVFQGRDPLNVINLRREFTSLRAVDGTDMGEHVRKLRRMHLSLLARGQFISEQDFCSTLLTSLPGSWRAFITVIHGQLANITAEVLMSKVTEEDQLRKQDTIQETALRTSGSGAGSRNTGKSNLKRGKCHNCGKKGHFKQDCWAPGGGKAGQGPRNAKSPKKDRDDQDNGPAQAKMTAETETEATPANDYAFVTGVKADSTNRVLTTDWLADSAATTHIARDRKHFSEYHDEPSQVEGIVPGTMLQVLGWGTVPLEFKVGSETYTIALKNVKYAPSSANNLISIGRVTAEGYTVTIDGAGIKITTNLGKLVGEGQRSGFMFKMRAIPKRKPVHNFAAVARAKTWDKWHRILGHIGIGAVKRLERTGIVNGMEVDKTEPPTQCAACIQGKQHVEPFPQSASDRESDVGDTVVSDVWGPSEVEGLRRERYYISFTDLKSRYSVVYFSAHKSDALKYFRIYKAFTETQLQKKIRKIRTDNGGEYVNREFQDYCKVNGIIMETTAPYSPAQNGIAERLNRTLVESARAMIFAKNLPKSLWPEAVSYACYIKNRSPVRALDGKLTPYEAFFKKKPDVSRLEEFGTRCWVMVPDERRTKLQPKAEQHLFVGVSEYSKSWKYFNTRSRKIQHSRNVTFDETDTKLFPIPNLDDDDDDDQVQEPVRPAMQPAHQPQDDPDGGSDDDDPVAPGMPPQVQPRRSARITSQATRWDYRTMT
jgi:transposase InsO family protein